jgi:hypothetical protein
MSKSGCEVGMSTMENITPSLDLFRERLAIGVLAPVEEAGEEPEEQAVEAARPGGHPA